MAGSNYSFVYNAVYTAAQWDGFFEGKQDWSQVLSDVAAQGLPPAYAPPETWVPADSSSANLTFTGIAASCSIVGNMAFAQASLTFPTTSDTNAIQIAGLPEPAVNQPYGAVPFIILNSSGAILNGIIIPGTSTFGIYDATTGAAKLNSFLSARTISFQAIFPLS